MRVREALICFVLWFLCLLLIGYALDMPDHVCDPRRGWCE